MGEEPGFWRHWWRGAKAYWHAGAAIVAAVLGTAALALLVGAAYSWAAKNFHLPSFEPNLFIVAVIAAAGIVLFAPNILSSDNEKKNLFPAWRAKPPASPPRPVAIEVADGFSFLDGVLCEEVRREVGGRWMLLGAHGDAITVRRFPCRLKLSGLLNVETTKAFLDPLPARIRLDDRVVASMRLASKGETGSWTIELIARVVDVAEPGPLHIDIGVDGETWTEVMRKSVRGIETDDA